MMELFIETLTGAAFELRVSPFETIMSVKAKIQRLEGIPISQQHLIWQTVELDDDYCLHDYDIHSGATLKLVLAMRGGPINTRRVPIEDSSLVEYMESTPDELLDKLPGSSRQVTLLVFREGDQLNFFRVVDRGDGTLTPLSESLSAASMYNMYDDDDDCETSNKEQSEENAKIREKISLLKDKMDNMSISKKSRKSSLPSAASGTVGRPTSTTRLQSLNTAQSKPLLDLNKNRCLPPVQQKITAPPTDEHDYAQSQSSSAQSRPTPTQLTQPLTEIIIPKPPSEMRMARHDTSQRLHHHHSQINMSDLSASGAVYKPTKSYSARSSRRHLDMDGKSNHTTESRIRCIPEHEAVTESRITAEQPKSLLKTPHPPPPFVKRRDSTDKLSNLSAASVSAAAADTSGPVPPPHLVRRSSSRQHDLRAPRQHGDLTLNTIKDSFYSQRITLESLSSNEAKMMSGLLQQASLEKLGSSTISNFSPPLRNTAASRKGATSYTNQMSVEDDDGVIEHAMSATIPKIERLESIGSSSAKLPPVKSKKVSKSKRCYICGKKTGLATSYICRCGNNFCATHRYAEMHDCSFDYKTEGRQLLEQSNPVVSAPKLPKI